MKKGKKTNNKEEQFSPLYKEEELAGICKNLKAGIAQKTNLPFTIRKLCYGGFIVNITGLDAFIPFEDMPWQYLDNNSWIVVFPQLLNKNFICNVVEVSIKPFIIKLDAKIPQFKQAELEIGKEYDALILEKKIFGIDVEMGEHFNWECGSVRGLLYKDKMGFDKSVLHKPLGSVIKVIYLGLKENGHRVGITDIVKSVWNEGKPEELIGQTVRVKVVKLTDEHRPVLMVNGKFRGVINHSPNDYDPQVRREIMQYVRDLKDKQIIECNVIGIDNEKRLLKLQCFREIEPNDEHKSKVAKRKGKKLN